MWCKECKEWENEEDRVTKHHARLFRTKGISSRCCCRLFLEGSRRGGRGISYKDCLLGIEVFGSYYHRKKVYFLKRFSVGPWCLPLWGCITLSMCQRGGCVRLFGSSCFFYTWAFTCINFPKSITPSIPQILESYHFWKLAMVDSVHISNHIFPTFLSGGMHTFFI